MLDPTPPTAPLPRRPAPVLEEVEDVADLLREAGTGDNQAWRRLVERYAGRVYGLLFRQCRDQELAEELTQATFVKLVDNLGGEGGYQEKGRFEAYLFRVAVNGLRDEMRRRKRQAQPFDMSPGAASGRQDETSAWAGAQDRILQGGPAPAESPSDRLDREEDLERLRQAVSQLSEADREVIHLRHMAGLSFAQIAETLQQPLGTVLARAHRALAKLRKMLDDEESS